MRVVWLVLAHRESHQPTRWQLALNERNENRRVPFDTLVRRCGAVRVAVNPCFQSSAGGTVLNRYSLCFDVASCAGRRCHLAGVQRIRAVDFDGRSYNRLGRGCDVMIGAAGCTGRRVDIPGPSTAAVIAGAEHGSHDTFVVRLGTTSAVQTTDSVKPRNDRQVGLLRQNTLLRRGTTDGRLRRDDLFLFLGCDPGLLQFFGHSDAEAPLTIGRLAVPPRRNLIAKLRTGLGRCLR